MRKASTLLFIAAVSLVCVVSLYAGSTVKNPDVVTLDSLQEKYEPVIFTHSKHASLVGNCGQCHHEHGNSSALPCKDCHAVTPASFKQSATSGFMPCRGCHTKPDPNNPKLVSLKVAYHSQCFDCHRGMGNIGTDPKGCTELCHAAKGTIISKAK